MVDVASMSPTIEVVLISFDWIGRRLWVVSIVAATESVLIASVVATVTILVIVSIVAVVLLAAVAIAALLLVLLLRLIIVVACVEQWMSIVGCVGVMAELLLHGLQLFMLFHVDVREIVDRCLAG